MTSEHVSFDGSSGGAAALAARIVAARTDRRWTAQHLSEVSGLSPRTLRDIESGVGDRNYSPNTLAALDRAFGWQANTCWLIWRGQIPGGATPEQQRTIEEQIEGLRRQIAEQATSPPWMQQLIEVCRALTPEERRWVVEVAALAGKMSTLDRRLFLELMERRQPG